MGGIFALCETSTCKTSGRLSCRLCGVQCGAICNSPEVVGRCQLSASLWLASNPAVDTELKERPVKKNDSAADLTERYRVLLESAFFNLSVLISAIPDGLHLSDIPARPISTHTRTLTVVLSDLWQLILSYTNEMGSPGLLISPSDRNDTIMADYAAFLSNNLVAENGHQFLDLDGMPFLPLQAPPPSFTSAVALVGSEKDYWSCFYGDPSGLSEAAPACRSVSVSSEGSDNSEAIFIHWTDPKATPTTSRKRSRDQRSQEDPTVAKNKGKARKQNEDKSPAEREDHDESLKRKQAHSANERRYRDKLNNNMKQLYHTLLESKQTSRLSRYQFSDNRISTGLPSDIKKADIISDAIQYIHQAQVDNRHMAAEISQLKARIQMLECLERNVVQDVVKSNHIYTAKEL